MSKKRNKKRNAENRQYNKPAAEVKTSVEPPEEAAEEEALEPENAEETQAAEPEEAPAQDDPETRETVSEEVFFDSENEENGAEDAEVSEIIKGAISEDEQDSSAEPAETPAEQADEKAPQYSDKAREEFEEAQRKQAIKTKNANKVNVEKSKEDDDKRIARRKRRIRNQVIAYLVVFIFVAVIVGGGGFAVKHFLIDSGVFKNNKPEVSDVTDQDVSDAGEVTDVDTTEEPVDIEPIPEPDPEPVEPEPVVEEPVAEVDTLGDYIDGIIAGMTLEQKVSGIIMTSPEALTKVNLATMAGEGTRNALAAYPVGGLVYAAKNVTSHDQFKAMLDGTKGMVTEPTFFAIAEEGGKNNSPLAKVDFYEAVGSAQNITETNDVANAEAAGNTIGSALSELGINVVLAPVADISSEAAETLDGRTYGNSATDVMGYVTSMETGLEAGGVTSCLKYFPGQGYATSDPETARTVIDKSEEDYRAGDFQVYQACIDNGAKMIMISNAVVNAFDDSQPATLSDHIVTDILRNEMGYDGVILSGNLGDVAIMDYYGADEAAILAIKAGCDMILNPYEFETAYNGIIKAVGDGVISEERINDSLKRIYRIKYAGSV